jgi:hypothetical protein
MHLLLPLLLACSETGLDRYWAEPLAAITYPADGAAFLPGQTIPFVGAVSDPYGDASENLAIAWASDAGILDQTPPDTLGHVGFGTGVLPVGLHTITLRVTDSDQMSTAAAVTVAVLPEPEDTAADTGEAPPTEDTGDADSGHTPTDTAPDTAAGIGRVTVTWATPGEAAASSLRADGTGAATWADAATRWATTEVGSGSSITFQLDVPEGGAVRYSVEAVIDGRTSWGCESTSTDEAYDALRGTHTVTYEAANGARCTLSPAIHHKSAGVSDGCEVALFTVACP